MIKVKDSCNPEEYLGVKLTKKGNIKVEFNGMKLSGDRDLAFKYKFTGRYSTRFVTMLEHVAYSKIEGSVGDRVLFDFVDDYSGKNVEVRIHKSSTGETYMITASETIRGTIKATTLSLEAIDVGKALDTIDEKATELLKRRKIQ